MVFDKASKHKQNPNSVTVQGGDKSKLNEQFMPHLLIHK
jgi:hypothetical protein